MSEMIERVAQAIAAADNYPDLQDAHDLTLQHYTKLAHAAIEAMQADLCEYAKGFTLEDIRRPVLEALWWRIDEALK